MNARKEGKGKSRRDFLRTWPAAGLALLVGLKFKAVELWAAVEAAYNPRDHRYGMGIDVDTHGGRYLCWQCHYPHLPEGA